MRDTDTGQPMLRIKCPADSVFHYGAYFERRYGVVARSSLHGWYIHWPRTSDPAYYLGTKRARVAIALILLNYALR